MADIKLGRHKKQLVTVDAKTFQDWQIDGYQKAVGKASLTGFRKAANKVKSVAIGLAPRSQEHRTVRTYPSGYKSDGGGPDAQRLSDRSNVKIKVGTQRGTQDAYYAYVRSRPGYSIFVEYGTKYNKEQSYLRQALEQSKEAVIPLLRAEWPR